MNPRILFLIFALIFFCNFSFALPLNIEFEKESFYSGETVQGKIYFDESFQDELNSNDFYISLEESTNVYPVLFDFENYTYFYFDLPLDLVGGSYDFVVEDVIYLENEVLVEEDQIFNFELFDLDRSIVTIDPALINVNLDYDNWFEIDIVNPSDYSAFVNMTFADDFIFTNYDSFSLSSGRSKNVKFYISSFADKAESSILIDYGNLSYSVPVFIEGFVVSIEINETPISNETNETEVIEPEGKLIFITENFSASLKIDESKSGFVKVFNDFNQEIQNIEFELTGNLEKIIDLEFDNIDSIFAGEEIKNHFYVNENKESEVGEYSGSMNVFYGGEVVDSIEISINVYSEEEDLPLENDTILDPIDDEPDEPEEDPPSNMGLFLGIIVFILILGIFILVRYKKSKKVNSPLGEN